MHGGAGVAADAGRECAVHRRPRITTCGSEWATVATLAATAGRDSLDELRVLQVRPQRVAALEFVAPEPVCVLQRRSPRGRWLRPAAGPGRGAGFSHARETPCPSTGSHHVTSAGWRIAGAVLSSCFGGTMGPLGGRSARPWGWYPAPCSRRRGPRPSRIGPYPRIKARCLSAERRRFVETPRANPHRRGGVRRQAVHSRAAVSRRDDPDALEHRDGQ